MERNPNLNISKLEAISINRITGFNRNDINVFYDNWNN